MMLCILFWGIVVVSVSRWWALPRCIESWESQSGGILILPFLPHVLAKSTAMKRNFLLSVFVYHEAQFMWAHEKRAQYLLLTSFQIWVDSLASSKSNQWGFYKLTDFYVFDVFLSIVITILNWCQNGCILGFSVLLTFFPLIHTIIQIKFRNCLSYICNFFVPHWKSQFPITQHNYSLGYLVILV